MSLCPDPESGQRGEQRPAVLGRRAAIMARTGLPFAHGSWPMSALLDPAPEELYCPSTGRSTMKMPAAVASAYAPAVMRTSVIAIPARPLCRPELIAPSKSRTTFGPMLPRARCLHWTATCLPSGVVAMMSTPLSALMLR